jgi:mevalonate kinase
MCSTLYKCYVRHLVLSRKNPSTTPEIAYPSRVQIGFVKHHKEQIEHIQRLQDDSMRQFFVESIKQNRNEDKILKIKQDIRDNVKLLSELGLGTPIISAIKSKLEDAKTVQTR